MTKPQHLREHEWHERKHNPNPHGEVKSLKQLAEEPLDKKK